MRYLVAVLPALAAAAPAQQLSLAINDGPSYASTTTGGRDYAFRFTANAPILVAAQVFTGDTQPHPHTLTIYSRHPTTGLPDQPISLPAQWTVASARCWQGATFPAPVPLSIGVDYFLFWRAGFSQHSLAPYDPSNPPQLVEMHQSIGSLWLFAANAPAKFRLFVPYSAGPTSAYGTGKAGEHGVPTIGLHGWPALGSPIDVWLGDAARQVPAVLVLGTPIPGGVPLGFANLFVTPDVLLVLPTETNFPELGPLLTGGASTTVAVPNMPSAVGFPLSFQWGVFDPLALDGFSHTSAMTALIN